MIKGVLTAATAVLVSALSSTAGVELGVNFGYGFPTHTLLDDWYLPYAEYEGVDTDTSFEFTEYRNLYYSLGKGMKIAMDFTYYLGENFGLRFGSGLSLLGTYRIESSVRFMGVTTSEETTVHSSFIHLNAGLVCRASMDRLTPYAYVMPGLYVPLGVNGAWAERVGAELDWKATYKARFAPGFGVTSGAGVVVRISEVFGIRFEFTPQYASARLKEVEIEDEGETYKEVFMRNEAELPDDTETTEYYRGGPKYSFSSLGANIGFSFEF